jgi:hypothetical protein
MIFRDGDFKRVVSVADSFDPTNHSININACEVKYLGRLLGSDLLSEIRAYAAEPDPETEQFEKFEELLSLCQLAIGNICFSDLIQGQSVMISQGGITVTSSESEKSASDSRLNALREELRNTGFNALESVLSHLYLNSDSFTSFAPKQSLLPLLANFEEYHSLSGSMLSFFALQPIIKRTEMALKETLTNSVYTQLVELSDADTSYKQDLKYHACSFLALSATAAGLQELPVKVGEMGVFIYPFSESLVVSPRRQAETASIASTVTALKAAAESSRFKLEKLLKDNAEDLGLAVPTTSAESMPFSPSRGTVVL